MLISACLAFASACDPVLFSRPATVVKEFESWNVSLLGLTGPRFYKNKRIEALRSDGSFVGCLVDAGQVEILDVPSRAKFFINFSRREINRYALSIDATRGGIAEPPRPPAPPIPLGLQIGGACAAEAVRGIAGAVKSRTNDVIAGYRVERYRGIWRWDPDYHVNAAFAPELQCVNLEWIQWRGWWLTPYLEWHTSRVSSIRFGEPDPALFQLPAGYKTIRH